MLIEIPDLDVILSVIVAFLVGLVGVFAYYKFKPIVKVGDNINSLDKERLEYYEKQLIDMKIRLDSLEIQGISQNSEDSTLELKAFIEKLAKKDTKEQVIEPKQTEVASSDSKTTPIASSMDNNNPIDYVLHLITNKPMTSRDIQITLKRSREHTSRLMKKLFEDGYVERNTDSKPYTYSISDKGKEKIGIMQYSPNTV